MSESEHPGRWPVDPVKVRITLDTIFFKDKSDRAMLKEALSWVCDYILQVERNRDELKERLSFQEHRGDMFLEHVNRLQQENAVLRKELAGLIDRPQD